MKSKSHSNFISTVIGHESQNKNRKQRIENQRLCGPLEGCSGLSSAII
jgi:hypothetical protein